VADSTSALIFPFTDLSPDQARLLDPLVRPLILYLPAGMEPSSGLAELARSGLVELVRPAAELAGDRRLRTILVELRRWSEEFRDLKELAHLRSLSRTSESEASPLSLASAIRSYGQAGDRPDLTPHLILHLSAWLDRKKAEIRSASAGLKGQEEELKRALGEGGEEPGEPKQEGFPSGPDPLQVPEPEQDQLLRLRLKAWVELYEARPMKAGLWLTRPEAAALLAADLRERTGRGPQEKKGWGSGPLREKAGFRVWRFGGADLKALLGLKGQDLEEQVLVAEMELG